MLGLCVSVASAPATLDAREDEGGSSSRVLMWRDRSEWNRGVWVLDRHLWRIIGQDVVVQRRRKAAPAQQSTYIARLQRFVVL